MLKIFLLFILTSVIFPQDTSKVLVTFSEQMWKDDLLVISNYKVTDSSANIYSIYKVGVSQDTTQAVLFTNKLPYNQPLKVVVINVRDRAGNKIGVDNNITFYFNGYKPEADVPDIGLRKK